MIAPTVTRAAPVRAKRVMPGLSLSLGITLLYLAVIVLAPVAALVLTMIAAIALIVKAALEARRGGR